MEQDFSKEDWFLIDAALQKVTGSIRKIEAEERTVKKGIEMQVSEPMAIQETLYVIDMLKTEKRDISVVAVWKRLIVETGYEYPRSVIEKTIQDYDQYVFNVKTHGYERN